MRAHAHKLQWGGPTVHSSSVVRYDLKYLIMQTLQNYIAGGWNKFTLMFTVIFRSMLKLQRSSQLPNLQTANVVGKLTTKLGKYAN